MYINVPEELRELSDLFERNGETLYIVGGHVRDCILSVTGTFHNDIDLCSACRPQKVVKILKNTQFEVDQSNAELGTIIIKGKKRYEHTTFRRENYNLNGEHNPTGVEFIKDINQDARRRDFTINAIYYNISTGNIVDPVNGLDDLRKGLIKTPINSADSFQADAERILRMIRFACMFGFQVHEKVLENAIKFSKGVGNLTKNRLRQEFEKMILCDTYYPERKSSVFAHAKCMILLGNLDLWQYILPALEQIQKSKIKDEKGEELYCHIINTFSVCSPGSRLACLLHDVGKVFTKKQKDNFAFSEDWADIIIESNLGTEGLFYSKKVVERVKRIVKALDWDRFGYKPRRQVTKFIRDNLDIFDELCELKNAVALENTNFTQDSKIAKRWYVIYLNMIKSKTPMNLSELDLNGNDILDSIKDINQVKIGELLNRMLDYCLNNPKQNSKEILMEKIKKIVIKNPSYYFE